MKYTLSTQDIADIITYILTNELPEDLERSARRAFTMRASQFTLESDGKLYGVKDGQKLLAVADDDPVAVADVLCAIHLPNHIGMKSMYEVAKTMYVGFRREKIDSYVKGCIICQRNQPLKRDQAIRPIVASHRWERIIVDFIDLRKYATRNDGYGWILNVVDSYSKFIFAIATKNKSAIEVVKFLRSLIRNEGAPAILHTDNGKEFKNESVKAMCAEYKIKHVFGRPRHPQSQGQVERANQTIVRHMTKNIATVESKIWIHVIDFTVAKYNLTWHRAIYMTPMQMFRGRRGFNTHILDTSVDNQENDEACSSNSSSEFSFSNPAYTAPVLSSDLPPESVTEILDCNDELRVEDEKLQEYRPKYTASMQKYADVHARKAVLKCCDTVIIKNDFDNNTASRKEKLDDFYEKGTWEVITRNTNGDVTIEQNNVRRQISKDRLKKVKRGESKPSNK